MHVPLLLDVPCEKNKLDAPHWSIHDRSALGVECVSCKKKYFSVLVFQPRKDFSTFSFIRQSACIHGENINSGTIHYKYLFLIGRIVSGSRNDNRNLNKNFDSMAYTIG